jgi:hypothetical protein
MVQPWGPIAAILDDDKQLVRFERTDRAVVIEPLEEQEL